jgi:cytochrome b involved in lipid metabolism
MTKDKENKQYNIVIIGGGISGLYLANLFQKKLANGKNIAIFEKSYRVGGRVKSQMIDESSINIEEGAGRFMPNHRRLLGLIKRFGLKGEMIAKNPQHDAKLDRIIEKVQKYGTKNRSILQDLTYIELMKLCLTREEIEYYISKYGFGDEIHHLQAGHAIRQFAGDLRYDKKFYLMRCGLEKIVKELKKENEKKNISIHTQHLLRKVEFLGSNQKYSHPYRLEFETFDTFRKIVVYAREIALCLPPNSLSNIEFHLGTLKEDEEMRERVDRVRNMVYEGTLIRIYAKYRNIWFNRMKNSIVGRGILRNIIPVDQKTGIIQYYSDYNQAKELEQYRLADGADRSGDSKLLKQIIKEDIKREIGKNIGDRDLDPEWMKIFYWNAGVHHWKPNVDIDREIREIQWNTFGNKHNIGIIGEAFCRNQGWIEGALENAEEFYKEWVKRRKMHLSSRLRSQSLHNKKEYTLKEVAKHNTLNDAWTVIHNRVYNITKFIKKHPGGMIILNAAGKDGTKYFEYIQHPEYVRNIMEKYYIGNLIN